MAENDIKCPKCHGSKFTTLPDGRYKCVYCGAEFVPDIIDSQPKTTIDGNQPQIIINVNGQDVNSGEAVTNTQQPKTEAVESGASNNSVKKSLVIIAVLVVLVIIAIICFSASKSNGDDIQAVGNIDSTEVIDDYNVPSTPTTESETTEPSSDYNTDYNSSDNSSSSIDNSATYDESQDESNDSYDAGSDDEYQENEDKAAAGY